MIGILFDAIIQDLLIQPTVIFDFPRELSPLSKCRADDPSVAERFEVFAGGSKSQTDFPSSTILKSKSGVFANKWSGRREAPKELDEDYIRALAHGMPPTAGEGIGMDRLVMLLTDSHSIREVILFPLLRPLGPARDESAGETK